MIAGPVHFSTAALVSFHAQGQPPAAAPVSLLAPDVEAMSLTHCPLCIGLALLSVLRAGAHLLLLGLWFRRSRAAMPLPWQPA